MLSLSFFSKVDVSIKYAYRQVMSHLGLPFDEDQGVGSILSRDPKFEVLVFPETSQIDENEATEILSGGHAIMLSADLFSGSQLAEKLELETQQSITIGGLGGNVPPRISGFLVSRTAERFPLFYQFVRVLAEPDAIVRSEIEDLDGVRSSGVVWCTSGSRPIIIYSPQIFRTIAYLLGGSEATFPLAQQREWGLLDGYNNIVGRTTELGRRGFLEIPIVNLYEKLFSDIIEDVAKVRQIPLVRKWPYPDAKSMCLCLTHDVDQYRRSPMDLRRTGLSALANRNMKKAIYSFLLSILVVSPWLQSHISDISSTSKGKTVIEATKRTLGADSVRLTIGYLIECLRDMERRFGASSTFFFFRNLVDNKGERSYYNKEIKRLIDWLREQGCDVALHASKANGSNVRSEKHDLDEAIGGNVIGVRDHALNLIVPADWRSRVGFGMIYDSSFGYDSDNGFKAACCLPFQPFDSLTSTALPILEIPPAIQDWTLQFEHGLDMASGEAFERCAKIARKIRELGGVLNLNWHPFYDEQLYPGWNGTYARILDFCSHLGTWYASAAELAKWWTGREAVRLDRFDWVGDSLTLRLTSDHPIRGFCLRLSLPSGNAPKKIFSNRDRVKVVADGDGTFACLDLVEGETELRVETA